MNLKYIIYSFVALILAGSIASCSDDDSGTEAKGLSITPDTRQVSELGDNFTVTLEVGGPWRATADSWLSVSPENGAAGTHTITVTTQPLGDDVETSGKVTFSLADGSESKVLTVTRGETKAGRKTDSLALVALYNATNGNNWTVRWNLSKPMSTWEEVQLEEIDGEIRVTEVMLRNFGLKGTIPEAIKYMDKLRHFSVEKNAVTGKFPEFLCEMKQLQLINLAGNAFSGELPSKLFDLPNLVYLILYTNNFSGKLPDNIGNCKSLKYFYIYENHFEGSIPASFAQLTKLQYLQIQNNRFEGALPDFSAMDSLQWVECSRQGVFEDKPVAKPDQQSVILREYVSGGFTGDAPHFKNKPNLQYVLLFENRLTSSPKFTNCPNVEWVHVSNNQIGSLDPSVTTNMTKLDRLYVYECGLTSLPAFSNCPALKFLMVNSNNLTQMPEGLLNLGGIEELMAQDNQLSALPEGINKTVWPVIRHLNVAYNNLSTLPVGIWGLPLYSLSVQCNQIADELPAEIPAGTQNLHNVNLNCNKFKGSAAPLTTLYNVSVLYCSQNEFSGDFPRGFGELVGMKELTLDDNNLTGAIPSDLYKCKSLDVFHVYGNQMSGDIPANLLTATSKWCKWNVAELVLPQQEGYGFNTYNDPCK